MINAKIYSLHIETAGDRTESVSINLGIGLVTVPPYMHGWVESYEDVQVD